MIARGNTVRETTTALGISARTMHNHMTSIVSKLGSGYRDPGDDGSVGVREPRNPFPSIDSAAASAEPGHKASETGPDVI